MANFQNFSYYMPTRIMFGEGRFSELADVVEPFGRRALVVTYKQSDWADTLRKQIEKSLKRRGLVYIGHVEVDSEPNPSSIDHIYQDIKSKNIDVILGLGGGSVLDASKGLAVLITKRGKTWDYVGRDKVNEEVVPIIALPTTAGTGSEVTPYAIFKNADLRRKAGIISYYIFPKVAILDPKLTASCPPYTTAVSGIDAFAHALESFTSPTGNQMSDAVARKALELIGCNLSKAVHDGDDLAARSAMLLGSTLAGIAIAHAGTGIAHALGATLGGFYPVEHGRLVGIVLPEAIKYNTAVAKRLYAEVADLIGLDVSGLPPEAASHKLADQVINWLDDFNLAAPLRSLGIDRSSFPAMIADTSTQNSVGNNIRPVDGSAIEEFYEKLF
jgi:alcohol dehydrogenase class IV